MKNKKIKIAGFTLLEVLLSVTILIVIGGGVLVSVINSRKVRDLLTSGQNVLSVLRLAQSKALAGENNDLWGVHLNPSQYTLFEGSSFSLATSTQVFVLPSTVQIANINLNGGGSDIIFRKISGATDQFGNFNVEIIGTSQIFSIAVDSSGKVYQSGVSAPPSGTRLVDARHRNFDLGWSIKTYTNLILDFSDPPNPDTIQTTPLANFFDPGKTVFDWSGTVNVGGQDQTLRVHTLSVSDIDTILSIDRDCRYNTKQLKASIDTRDIATYSADCLTVTPGAYGGTMSEP